MKVGDYCYIKGISRDYGIGQITQLNSGYSSNGGELIDIQFKHSKHSVPKRDVVSSPNIIDLIEKKDIIKYHFNGYDYISEVFEYKNDLWVQNENNMFDISKINIKSIVTKEQFEQMEYKIQ